MCSKTGLTAKQTGWLGFGLDAGTSLFGFFQGRKETARENAEIARQNQLAINTYNTKNRNAVLKWNNAKQDSDIEVDNKWRETRDAIAESQLQAREVAGKAAIAQQQILAKMINSGQREQVGRRAGRGNIAQLGAEWAAAGAQAAFSRDSQILFQDKAGRNMAAFAQGKYVEYITGRPSPEAPPILREYKEGPSFLNTALSIASAGLNRYNQYKGYTAGKQNPLIPPTNNNQDVGGSVQQQSTSMYEPSSMGGAMNTFEVGSYQPTTFSSKTGLQAEMDDYFAQKAPSNDAATLGADFQTTFV